MSKNIALNKYLLDFAGVLTLTYFIIFTKAIKVLKNC